jgi:hypothetical protein
MCVHEDQYNRKSESVSTPKASRPKVNRVKFTALKTGTPFEYRGVGYIKAKGDNAAFNVKRGTVKTLWGVKNVRPVVEVGLHNDRLTVVVA